MPLPPSEMTPEEMTAITRKHAELEQQGISQYEPLLETLVEEPIFEFHPPGGQLIGGDTIRRYYTRFLNKFMPLVKETILCGEWADSSACVHEYQLGLLIDGKMEYHQLTGVIYGSGKLMGGERLYGSAKLNDLMLGPFKDELVPIEGRSEWGISVIELNQD